MNYSRPGGRQAPSFMKQNENIGDKSGEQESPSKNYAEKVDLNDLDWEDRERVLRLLFSKINAGVHPSMKYK